MHIVYDFTKPQEFLKAIDENGIISLINPDITRDLEAFYQQVPPIEPSNSQYAHMVLDPIDVHNFIGLLYECRPAKFKAKYKKVDTNNKITHMASFHIDKMFYDGFFENDLADVILLFDIIESFIEKDLEVFAALSSCHKKSYELCIYDNTRKNIDEKNTKDLELLICSKPSISKFLKFLVRRRNRVNGIECCTHFTASTFGLI